MNNEKLHLISKIFKNETIRTIWNKEDEKYYISVVDIVGVISESKDGRKYWNKLKQRLKENIIVAKKGGNIAKIAKEELEDELVESVITKDNRLNYKYK